MNSLIHHSSKKIQFSQRRISSGTAGFVNQPPTLPPAETSSFNPFSFFSNSKTSKKFCTVKEANLIHTHLLKVNLLFSNDYVTNCLLDLYCKLSDTKNALKLFDRIPNKNIISWNIMISACNSSSSIFGDPWSFFCRLWKSGYEPNELTYGSVLSSCTALRNVVSGEQVYAIAVKNGFCGNGFLRSGMIDLYAKNGRFLDALRVFHDDVLCDNVVCWNSVISAATKNGEDALALDIFSRMGCVSLVPNTYTFSSVLSACAALGELQFGRSVQGWAIKCGAKDVFVETAIVDLYAKSGDMDEAVKEFSHMQIHNVVSWTVVISGYVQNNDSVSALHFFKEMGKMGVEINSYTLTSVLTACANTEMYREASQIHAWSVKTGFSLDSAVSTSLVNMYTKMGAVEFSELVFTEMDNVTNVDSWASIIRAFSQSGSFENAIKLLVQMLWEGIKPDVYCLSSILSVVDDLSLGRQIHSYILKSRLAFDVAVSSSLFTMYSKCGNLVESNKVFSEMVYKDHVSWSSMIAGLTEHGCPDKALQLFREMLVEVTILDEMTCSSVLTACSALRLIQRGKEIHGYALRTGIVTGILASSALVTMYSKCSASKLARSVFDMMPEKDPVSCCSLISGYAHNGQAEEALHLFNEMRRAGLAMDAFTVSAVLGALELLDRPGTGAQLHGHVTKVGLYSEASVGTALLKLYSKCESTEDCHQVFNQIGTPDLIAWSSLIASYAQHGNGAEALRLYKIMKKEGIRPDSVTFVSVLSACSHNGLVEEAHLHFDTMSKDYGIKPNPRHYACIVDLLGRLGKLEEAEVFILNMPIEPDAFVWGTLLAACKVHGDIERGKVAVRKVIELNPCDDGAYISFSNICANMGLWDEVDILRKQMKGVEVKKEAGWSLV